MTNWFGLPFSDYDLWKTREPDYFPSQDEWCCEADCKRESEYEGRCEYHFSLRQEEMAEAEIPENEWGMLEL